MSDGTTSKPKLERIQVVVLFLDDRSGRQPCTPGDSTFLMAPKGSLGIINNGI